MGATTAPNSEFWDAGKPIALPFYLVDVNGNTLSFSTIAGNVNLNQVGGATFALGQATMSNSVPVVLPSNQTVTTEQQLEVWARNAQVFTVTTGAQAGATQTSGVNIFNANTVKNAYIFSIFVMNSNPGQGVYTSIRKVTTNPTFSNAITPVCTVLNSANTSLMTATWQASASVSGIDLGTNNFNSINSSELLQIGGNIGRGFLLGANANSGLSIYVGQSGTGGFWSVTYTYAEF